MSDLRSITDSRRLPAHLLLWLWRKPQVGLNDAHIGEQRLGLFVCDGRMHDNVVATGPVDRGRDAVLVAELERVDDAQDLGRVAAGRGWVGEDGADGLFRIDDEDAADGKGNALAVDVCGVLVVDPVVRSMKLALASTQYHDLHVIFERYLALLVANNGKAKGAAIDLVDVLDPTTMALDGIRRQADELDAALAKLGLELGKGSELRRAHRRVVLGVREENDPGVADEVVEADGALGRFGFEIGRRGTEAETSIELAVTT